MDIWKTDKSSLTAKEILDYIGRYEREVVPNLDVLRLYAKGRNIKVSERKEVDENSPNEKIVVSYGKKIVTTWTGYGYRPRYITYKGSSGDFYKPEDVEKYLKELQRIFNKNKEHIKTSANGKKEAIYGVAYELVYVDGEVMVGEGGNLKKTVMPRFFPVDPAELILLYDYSPETKKKIAIRYYPTKPGTTVVEVYYPEKIETFERVRADEGFDTEGKYKLIFKGSATNFFGAVPVAAYYFDPDREVDGVIESVIPLIDAYDILFSDSMNEFSRFSQAYLVMKNYGLVEKMKKADEQLTSRMLKFIKRFRIFEWLPDNADIKFLTKDIPSEFISFMAGILREQIHIQSHVPDFTSERLAGASGVAIQRLLFDFENLVSSSDAEFDVGLYERIDLITRILKLAGREGSEAWQSDMVIISHKRNLPLDLKQFAEVAVLMKNAGFSSWLIADMMPDDVIPNVEEELDRQKKERKETAPNLYEVEEELDDEEEEGLIEEKNQEE